MTRQPPMEVITVAVLRCPSCGYERQLLGAYDPDYLDLRCPRCCDPSKCRKEIPGLPPYRGTAYNTGDTQ
jgi:hypothetical protein